MAELDHHARLAVLEHRVDNLDRKLGSIDGKLDELLQLRSKGVGAFWLASALLGTSILGTIITMVNWFRGS